MILVSSCLAGMKVRYNGTDSLDETIGRLVREQKAVTACPELMGGFTTPREPAEIIGGTGEDVLDGRAVVVERSGREVTELYVRGAYAALELAKSVQATLVVLKENSPSCGSKQIYDGTFSAGKIGGNGVTAALLRREGYPVISEEELPDYLEGQLS